MFVQAEQRLAGTERLEGPRLTNKHVRQTLSSALNHAAQLLNDDVVPTFMRLKDWFTYAIWAIWP